MVRKRICHVQLLPLLSGVQRVTLNEIASPPANSIEYKVIVSSNGGLTRKLDEIGVESYVINNLVRNIKPKKDILAFLEMFKLFRKLKFDIVHTHSSKTGFLGRISAKLAGVRLVVHTVHGFAFPSAKNRVELLIFYFMELIAARFTDKIIVLNKADFEVASKKLFIPRRKIFLIPNGVDVNVFSPKLDTLPISKVRAVMVGRLWEQKNPMCLIRAMKICKDHGFEFDLDYIGDGELRGELEHYVREHDLTSCVNFLGWKDNIESILPSYDMFILPSKWEGMPLAILEAMSSGLPCIVSNIQGNSDLVIENFNGFLFNTNDSQDLADKIMIYLRDFDLLELHSKNSRDLCLSNYSLRDRSNHLLKVYDI